MPNSARANTAKKVVSAPYPFPPPKKKKKSFCLKISEHRYHHDFSSWTIYVVFVINILSNVCFNSRMMECNQNYKSFLVLLQNKLYHKELK